jgi:hypothetical protein
MQLQGYHCNTKVRSQSFYNIPRLEEMELTGKSSIRYFIQVVSQTRYCITDWSKQVCFRLIFGNVSFDSELGTILDEYLMCLLLNIVPII